MDMLKCRLGFATVFIALISTVASAQSATVNGRVTNTQGGAMANADVTLRLVPGPGAPPAMPNMPGMNERTTNAGPDGAFAFDQVAPGEYVLQADLPGFGRSSQAITVPGPNLTFTLTLEALDLPGAVPADRDTRRDRDHSGASRSDQDTRTAPERSRSGHRAVRAGDTRQAG